MIYVIRINNQLTDNTTYTCFDTDTESVFNGKLEDIKIWLSSQGISIENLKLIRDKPVIKQWFNKIHSSSGIKNNGSDYILLSKMNEDKFKIVDYTGKVMCTAEDKLRKTIGRNLIANCKIRLGKIVSVNTYDILEDIHFNEYIDEKYKIYSAKMSLLGQNVSFYYTIENEQVRLVKYTGTSKTIILPNFITIIMNRAFMDCPIDSITLNRGIRSIGCNAFDNCNLP